MWISWTVWVLFGGILACQDGSSESKSRSNHSALLPSSFSQTGGRLDVGASVTVHVRHSNALSPYDFQGEFDRRTIIHAVDAPFSEGGVSGAQIDAAVRQLLGAQSFDKLWLHALEVGKNAPSNAGMISVGSGEGEFFNAYTGKTAKGDLHMFVDVQSSGL